MKKVIYGVKNKYNDIFICKLFISQSIQVDIFYKILQRKLMFLKRYSKIHIIYSIVISNLGEG